MPPRRILIIGAGIAGIASALALSRELTPFVPDLQITVFEKHDVLSTSGGAINLTPVAQRHLDKLGVLAELDRMGSHGGADIDSIVLFSNRSGKCLGTVDFASRSSNRLGEYRGRRVMRIILAVAMMEAANRAKNIKILFSKKLMGGKQTKDHAIALFEDGTTAQGDLILGCDGVHSATRTLWVDPSSPSEYTGISFVQTTMSVKSIRSPVHFSGTAVNVSRHGSLLVSFCDRECEQLFLAAMIEVDEKLLHRYKENPSWDQHARETAKKSLQEEMRQRFGQSGIPCVRDMVSQPSSWLLYPVYQVRPGGRWFSNHVLLLGDAAHAMPPRDESAAYALDDAIIFSRILARHQSEPLEKAFSVFQDVRRDTVNSAFKASQRMWAKNRDMGMLEGWLKEWTLPYVIRKQRDSRNAAWEFDASKIDLP